jgi:glutathione peroxidase
MQTTTVLDFTMKDIAGKEVSLRGFEGKVLLIVNVASKCGFTPQYEGLQKLYDRYRAKGFEILGFPANDFMWQEPGSDAEIQKFCSTKYSVTFPLFSKITVKGKGIHPLYDYLTNPETSRFPGKVGWNFAKFLLDRKGTVVGRFDPKTEPLSPEVTAAIEAVLAQELVPLADTPTREQ